MLKLIAILILAGQLQIAVEQQSGFAEKSFENSAAGAMNLIEFAEKSVGDAPDGVRIVVGWIDDNDNDEHIIQALSELGIKHGLVSPADVRAAMVDHKLPAPSAVAVARADEKRFGFLYRRRQ